LIAMVEEVVEISGEAANDQWLADVVDIKAK
jgi:hypothetical protein